MTSRLFVYGTLAPGRSNAHVLANVRGTWENASTRGKLLQEGWGAAAGYPGLIPEEEGPEVPGQLFTSDELGAHWARLDEFEGDGYERVLTSVKLENGCSCQAYVYALNR